MTKLEAAYQLLYDEFASAGITRDVVNLTGLLVEIPGKETFTVNREAVKLNLEDDGDALDSIFEVLELALKKHGFPPASPPTSFKLHKGNLWDFANKTGYRIFIMSNGTVKQNGANVMGRGCAKEAKDRFPELPLVLGELLKKWYKAQDTTTPPILWLEAYNLGVFPTKFQWYAKADLALIAESAKALRDMADEYHWSEKIVLPWPGCGSGGLKRQDVEPILKKYFDDRFIIIGLE